MRAKGMHLSDQDYTLLQNRWTCMWSTSILVVTKFKDMVSLMNDFFLTMNLIKPACLPCNQVLTGNLTETTVLELIPVVLAQNIWECYLKKIQDFISHIDNQGMVSTLIFLQSPKSPRVILPSKYHIRFKKRKENMDRKIKIYLRNKRKSENINRVHF